MIHHPFFRGPRVGGARPAAATGGVIRAAGGTRGSHGLGRAGRGSWSCWDPGSSPRDAGTEPGPCCAQCSLTTMQELGAPGALGPPWPPLPLSVDAAAPFSCRCCAGSARRPPGHARGCGHCWQLPPECHTSHVPSASCLSQAPQDSHGAGARTGSGTARLPALLGSVAPRSSLPPCACWRVPGMGCLVPCHRQVLPHSPGVVSGSRRHHSFWLCPCFCSALAGHRWLAILHLMNRPHVPSLKKVLNTTDQTGGSGTDSIVLVPKCH